MPTSLDDAAAAMTEGRHEDAAEMILRAAVSRRWSEHAIRKTLGMNRSQTQDYLNFNLSQRRMDEIAGECFEEVLAQR